MKAVTRAEMKRFAANARDDYIDALVDGWGELERAGIATPARFVEFIAQCAHETGGFTIVREATNWTAKQMCELWPTRFKTALDPRILACRGDKVKLANLAYSGRSDIGNCGGNDGWDYRGGSLLQDTGRDRFGELEAAIGVPLVSNPELIENAAIGLKCAIWTWGRIGGNRLADRGYTVSIGNAINRGNAYSSKLPIGHESRMQWRQRAQAVFGDNAGPLPGLALGARGSEVEALQRRLRDLGYGLGAIDGVFGPATARAVAAMKLDAKRNGATALEHDEIVGPGTWSALDAADKVSHPERESLSIKQATKELAAAGSQEVAQGQRQKAAGWLLLAGSTAKGAEEAGAFETASGLLGQAPQWKGLLVPVIDALKWGITNAFWVFTLIFGVWVWSGGHKTVLARVKAHVKGFNLFR